MSGLGFTEKDYFAPGADLWIVPERKQSNFVQTLDWYLNFQISKSAHHHTQPLPEHLREILHKCSLDDYDWAPQPSDSLLVLSSLAVPNRWVLVLRGSDQLEAWAKAAVSKWEKMRHPSVRIFLPRGVSVAEFEKHWKKAGGPSDAVIFADKESSTHG